MKIRFWPGMIWKTCAVQRLACGPVRIGIRKIALPPFGFLAYALERLLRRSVSFFFTFGNR